MKRQRLILIGVALVLAGAGTVLAEGGRRQKGRRQPGPARAGRGMAGDRMLALPPHIAKTMTEEQKAQAQEIVQAAHRQQRQLVKETRTKLMSLLTDEQKAQLKETRRGEQTLSDQQKADPGERRRKGRSAVNLSEEQKAKTLEIRKAAYTKAAASASVEDMDKVLTEMRQELKSVLTEEQLEQARRARLRAGGMRSRGRGPVGGPKGSRRGRGLQGSSETQPK